MVPILGQDPLISDPFG